MTPDYASLDAAIVKAIRDGTGYYFDTYSRVEAPISIRDFMARTDSLRKRGLIVYNNGRWSAVEKV